MSVDLLRTQTRLFTSVLDVDAGVHEGLGEDHRAQRLLAGATLHFKDVADCHGGLAMDEKRAIRHEFKQETHQKEVLRKMSQTGQSVYAWKYEI